MPPQSSYPIRIAKSFLSDSSTCVKLTIPLSSAEVKNEWTCISTPHHVWMLLLITLNENFSFIILYNTLSEIVFTGQNASLYLNRTKAMLQLLYDAWMSLNVFRLHHKSVHDSAKFLLYFPLKNLKTFLIKINLLHTTWSENINRLINNIGNVSNIT